MMIGMGKTALIFPRPGAQRAGMGRDFTKILQVQKVYMTVPELLGMDISLYFEPTE